MSKHPVNNTREEGRGPLILFVFGLLFFAFLYGFIAAYAKLPPYKLLHNAWESVVDLADHWRNDLGLEPTRHLVPAAPGRAAFTTHEPAAVSDGHRLIMGLTTGRATLYGATLYDIDGRELHFWPIDYRAVNPTGADPENVFPHGFEVFGDGSIMVNFDDGEGIARIGPCGDVLWSINQWFHHSISKADDATVWSWRGNNIVQLDPSTGKVLREINMRRDVIEAHGAHGAFALFTREKEAGFDYMPDAFHANDVDVLSAADAGAFPDFSAGDILVSLRSLNMVAVLDGETLEPRWWMIGPWHRQHDPDFLPDGTISVYDNNMGTKHSRIVIVDPSDNTTRVLIENSEALPFDSWRRGKHEHLPNGNILIAETEQGRVFEASPDGRLLWEFHNIHDDTRNGVISKAMRLPEGYFAPGALDCPAP